MNNLCKRHERRKWIRSGFKGWQDSPFDLFVTIFHGFNPAKLTTFSIPRHKKTRHIYAGHATESVKLFRPVSLFGLGVSHDVRDFNHGLLTVSKKNCIKKISNRLGMK